MFVALLDLNSVQLTSECILGWGSGIVGNFYASSLAHGVVIKIDIGALVEAVMRGLLRWRGEVVVDICKERGQ